MGRASRLKRERRDAKLNLFARLQSSGIAEGLPLVWARRGAKMSHALGELIEPYHDYDEDLNAFRKLELFPEDRRLILDASVSEQSDGSFYLVAAAVDEDLRGETAT